MAGLAQLAKALGYAVGGCDHTLYSPMKEVIEGTGIAVDVGFEGQALLDFKPDVVIVGNVVRRDFSVVDVLFSSRLKYMSAPQWLAQEVLSTRRVIAISGTHGKTTVTALLVHLLKQAGFDVGYLYAGLSADGSAQAALGTHEWFILEADEYDSAFFDKRPKFMHYSPWRLLMNNLEFDHADIYSNLGAIEQQFHYLMRLLPKEGHVVASKEASMDRVLERGVWCPVTRFGAAEQADFGFELGEGIEGSQVVQVRMPQGGRWSLPSPLWGVHNAHNLTAVVALLSTMVEQLAVVLSGLSTFPGVSRRLQLIEQREGVYIYDDFAHHPTAIAAGIQALRDAHPDARLYVWLHPKSNTWKEGAHDDVLTEVLAGADGVYGVLPLPAPVQRLQQWSDFFEKVALRPGDVIVWMSNQAFPVPCHSRESGNLP